MSDREHRMLTDFIVDSGLRHAEAAHHRHDAITLSECGAWAFMEAVYHPQPANAYLLQAAERYKASFGDR